VWSNRTHRSVSEAFRDADYATAIWRCETDLEQGFKFLYESFFWFAFIAVPVLALGLFVMWLFNLS
jgi:hypothetical protein